MPEFDLHFSPFSSEEVASFKLLELPPELASLVETAVNQSEPLNFVIKGASTEEAVLCTKDKTYSIRTVNLSNSLLVVSPPPDAALEFSDEAIVICDQLNEILELALTVPRISKLAGLLRGREYDETNEDEADDEVDDLNNRYTYAQAREDVQASDAELDKALRQKRILILKDELRPISLPYLNNVLEFLLNVLVARTLTPSSASVEILTDDLEMDHEIPRTVSRQVLAWFGEIHEGRWKMDVDEVVKELGLGILRGHKHDNPIEKRELLAKWKKAVGDTFESRVGLGLLAGNYLEHKKISEQDTTLTYFPGSTLPTEPAARFSDLFLTRSRWRVEDITPFLEEIAVNSKERDKLLLKYCRAITEAGGIWYTARAQYNG